MKTLYDLFTSESFRKRPAMWIGKKSITTLKTVVNGFLLCEEFNGIEPELNPPFELFLPWIQKRYNHDGSYYNWDGVILLNHNWDEEEAFDKFLQLFDEFIALSPRQLDELRQR